MKQYQDRDMKLLVAVAITFFIFGVGIAAGTAEWLWKKQAIEHKAAEYDSVTGQWRWKEAQK